MIHKRETDAEHISPYETSTYVLACGPPFHRLPLGTALAQHGRRYLQIVRHSKELVDGMRVGRRNGMRRAIGHRSCSNTRVQLANRVGGDEYLTAARIARHASKLVHEATEHKVGKFIGLRRVLAKGSNAPVPTYGPATRRGFF